MQCSTVQCRAVQGSEGPAADLSFVPISFPNYFAYPLAVLHKPRIVIILHIGLHNCQKKSGGGMVQSGEVVSDERVSESVSESVSE